MSHLTLLLILLVTITLPRENVINKQIMTAPKATRIDLPNETKIEASIKCTWKILSLLIAFKLSPSFILIEFVVLIIGIIPKPLETLSMRVVINSFLTKGLAPSCIRTISVELIASNPFFTEKNLFSPPSTKTCFISKLYFSQSALHFSKYFLGYTK